MEVPTMLTIATPILPTEQDARQARDCSGKLSDVVSSGGAAGLRVTAKDGRAVDMALPLPAAQVLVRVLKEMGQGNGVAITPIRKELTTQQAADLLMVSRPYLIKELLDTGKIPYRRVGNRRRIRFDDLVRYRETEEQEVARREAVMRELVAETERLGLYR
jgi:excisionase family DNA binding protein